MPLRYHLDRCSAARRTPSSRCSPSASSLPTQGDAGDEDEDFSAGVSVECATLDDLDEKGGAIADGRWVLTASALVDDEADPDAGTSVVAQKAAVLSFAGNEVAWATDTDVFVLPYGAGATVLRIRTTGNEYVDTYTKR